jgi:methionyl-tRNA synthetase
LSKPERYTITAALPYANGPLHIGHVAGAYLPADIFVRYLRLKGEEVAFICGSDEHGVPITLRAREEGVSPQKIVDRYHELNKASFEEFGIEFDIFHRTSDQLHYETASQFFTELYEKGEFIEKEEKQYYDPEYEEFLADRYIVGTCPDCGYEEAYGDQCEQCGTSLNANELLDPVSALSGKEPERKKTKHWYLPLDKYQEEWLEEWIHSHKDDWKANVYGQCKSWLDKELAPRAVTRDLPWGVPVPLKEAKDKVLYVWFDAPIGYISATKAWAEQQGVDWKKYWQDENTSLIHFIGKDNIVFHCLIFPSMLKAHDDFILPDNVPANEFLNLEGDKLSTSRGWAVWLHEYLEDFPDKQDELRYSLCANMPEMKDNNFSWEGFQRHNNSELVGILGNFVHRTMVLTHKYFDGKVPPVKEFPKDEATQELRASFEQIPQQIGPPLEEFKFRQALKGMMEVARQGNGYLTEKEPWKLINVEQEQVAAILYLSLQLAGNLAIAMQPFLPFVAQRLTEMLKMDENDIHWDNLGRDDLLLEGNPLNEPELLFEKMEDEVVEQQVQKLKQRSESEETQKSEPMEQVNFEDFTRLDFRVGKIVKAETIKKADKLLKLTVDIGEEERTVLAGIAQTHEPKQVEGQSVVVLANLKPKKMMGIESEGMVLMAEDDNGRLSFIRPEDEMPPGSKIH